MTARGGVARWARGATVATLALLCSANSCEEHPGPAMQADATPTACGAGAPVARLGVGQPFEPLDTLIYEVDEGLQGGVHIDVSVRIAGRFDPDSVDVALTLWQGDWAVGQHLVGDWLLFLPPGDADALPPAERYCDYPRARMVLVEPDGALLRPDQLGRIVDQPLRLEVNLSSALGAVATDFEVRLQNDR